MRTLLVNSVPQEVEAVEFEATEPWAIAALPNGDLLKIKIVFKEILKVIGQVDELGGQQYHPVISFVVHPVHAEENKWPSGMGKASTGGGMVN